MPDKKDNIKELIAERQADALAWFLSAHPPVETFAESNNYMSSQQVKAMIEQETDFFFPFVGDLKNALRETGYVQEELDGNMVWLLAH